MFKVTICDLEQGRQVRAGKRLNGTGFLPTSRHRYCMAVNLIEEGASLSVSSRSYPIRTASGACRENTVALAYPLLDWLLLSRF